jgi:hypothetical protein
VEGRDGQDEARAGNKRRLPSLSRTTRRVTAGHTRSAGFRFESSQAVSGSGEVVTGVATEQKRTQRAMSSSWRLDSRERGSRDGWARSPAGPCGAQADNQLG